MTFLRGSNTLVRHGKVMAGESLQKCGLATFSFLLVLVFSIFLEWLENPGEDEQEGGRRQP